MTTFLSLDDPDLQQKIGKLTPTAGYLLLADLVGSTLLKRGKNFKEWAADFLFPFINITNNIGKQEPIKVVGDMAMYWFPESTGPDPESIMTGLMKVQKDSNGEKLRMAFVRCTDVYEVSFHRHVPEDVYGSDVDLCARLLTKAKAGEILMNSTCPAEIVNRMKGIDFSSEIKGPERTPFKGFEDVIEIFIWRTNNLYEAQR